MRYVSHKRASKSRSITNSQRAQSDSASSCFTYSSILTADLCLQFARHRAYLCRCLHEPLHRAPAQLCAYAVPCKLTSGVYTSRLYSSINGARDSLEVHSERFNRWDTAARGTRASCSTHAPSVWQAHLLTNWKGKQTSDTISVLQSVPQPAGEGFYFRAPASRKNAKRTHLARALTPLCQRSSTRFPWTCGASCASTSRRSIFCISARCAHVCPQCLIGPPARSDVGGLSVRLIMYSNVFAVRACVRGCAHATMCVQRVRMFLSADSAHSLPRYGHSPV